MGRLGETGGRGLGAVFWVGAGIESLGAAGFVSVVSAASEVEEEIPPKGMDLGAAEDESD